MFLEKRGWYAKKLNVKLWYQIHSHVFQFYQSRDELLKCDDTCITKDFLVQWGYQNLRFAQPGGKCQLSSNFACSLFFQGTPFWNTCITLIISRSKSVYVIHWMFSNIITIRILEWTKVSVWRIRTDQILLLRSIVYLSNQTFTFNGFEFAVLCVRSHQFAQQGSRKLRYWTQML